MSPYCSANRAGGVVPVALKAVLVLALAPPLASGVQVRGHAQLPPFVDRLIESWTGAGHEDATAVAEGANGEEAEAVAAAPEGPAAFPLSETGPNGSDDLNLELDLAGTRLMRAMHEQEQSAQELLPGQSTLRETVLGTSDWEEEHVRARHHSSGGHHKRWGPGIYQNANETLPIRSPLGFGAKQKQKQHHGAFIDVSSRVFPAAWYTWNHVGYPRRYACTPVFQDINGDGLADFFYHNHYQASPEKEWDLGISRGGNSWLLDEAVNDSLFEAATSSYIVSTEQPGTPWTRFPADMHNSVILDIDRDGLLDMYITTGGGMGVGHGPTKNPLLLWGEAGEPGAQAKQRFKGGRNVVEAANLQNLDSRGRFTYFWDFDKDGLLDVVFANDVRVDGDNRFGYAMRNRGDRSFEPYKGLSEYSSTMVLHDADGDGRAEELVMQRSRCLPVDGEDGTPAAVPDNDYWAFCKVRPLGSTAIYKYLNQSLQLISPTTSIEADGEREPVRSMQTGDFDRDQLADLLLLYPTGISFYFSSRREAGSLPLGVPSAYITWNSSECAGRGLRVADFNLDGKQDLLIMCNQPGTHRLYMQGNKGHFWLRTSLGDIASQDLPLLNHELLGDVCATAELEQPVYLRGFCSLFSGGQLAQPQPHPTTYGVGVVDFDNDGYPDVVLTHDVGALMMLRNNFAATQGPSRFLAVRLVGSESNEYGIGATVLLQARQMGNNRTTIQLREISSANHETDWWGSKDDRLIFGLGKTGIPTMLTVRWPGKSQNVQVIDDEIWLQMHCNSMTDLLVVRERDTSRAAAP